MPSCCIPNCGNGTGGLNGKKNIKYFYFPKDEKYRAKWIDVLLDKNINIDIARICENHFTKNSFENRLTKPRSKKNEPKIMKRLKHDAIPTINLLLPQKEKKKNITRERSFLPTYKELVECVKEKLPSSSSNNTKINIEAAIPSEHDNDEISIVSISEQLQESNEENNMQTTSNYNNRNNTINRHLLDTEMFKLLHKSEDEKFHMTNNCSILTGRNKISAEEVCKMQLCSVYGCPNSITSDQSIQYYSFPKNSLSQQWIQACGWQNDSIDVDTARICSLHFDENAFITEIKLIDFAACYVKTLKDDAVPTLYLPHTQIIFKETFNENDKDVVVYTINSSVEGSGTTTVSVGNADERQLFGLELSPDIKIETNLELPEKIFLEEKYKNVKSYPDLYLVQAHNKCIRRKIQHLREQLPFFKGILRETESNYKKIDHELYEQRKLANKKVFSQQEQKTILSKVFSESQIKILFGKKKIYWSNDDMGVGYTIRHLSNKRCYAYLTKTLNIPLPAMSSIKRWVTTKKIRKLEDNCIKKNNDHAYSING